MEEKSISDSNHEASESVTDHFHMHPSMERLGRITPVSFDTAGQVKIPTLLLGSGRAMVEVGVSTQKNGCIVSTEVENTVTV